MNQPETSTAEIPDLLSLEINGFRSLRDFKIGIRQGLNIITGKNGSGKTNFIEFLDFMSLFVGDGLGAAVSTLGGTSRIFSQEMLRSKNPTVSVTISGTARIPTNDRIYSVDTDAPLFNFEYRLVLRMIKKAAIVVVSKESIAFFPLHSNLGETDGQKAIGKLEVQRKYNQNTKDIETTYTIGRRLTSSSIKNPLRFVMRPRTLRGNEKTRSSVERIKLLEEGVMANIDETESIFSKSYFFPAMRSIERILSRSRSFNLLPSQIRKLSNITDEPDILPDGSGLSAVLYNMARAQENGGSSAHYMYQFEPDMLPKVISWTNLLIPELDSITSTADLNTGKYLASLWISSSDRLNTLRIPFQSASDGTLKWLALACKLAQNPRYLSIEEPENFLHPQMQSFLIQMLREIEEGPDGDLSYVLLSTHSETIINNCDPSELILFNFSDHRSQCRRVGNRENLIEQMNKTSFGLGHYYVANAVS